MSPSNCSRATPPRPLLCSLLWILMLARSSVFAKYPRYPLRHMLVLPLFLVRYPRCATLSNPNALCMPPPHWTDFWIVESSRSSLLHFCSIVFSRCWSFYSVIVKSQCLSLLWSACGVSRRAPSPSPAIRRGQQRALYLYKPSSRTDRYQYWNTAKWWQ